ncbi:MAG: Sjogren's syndrome/scleroderma autoantigen 1 family protein [Halobacteriota archaeon]
MSDSDDKIKQISRLLELGGTMLAQHCSTCGAPMFRYHGEVLCPICQGEGVGSDILPQEPAMSSESAAFPQTNVTGQTPMSAAPPVSSESAAQLSEDQVPISFTSPEVSNVPVSTEPVKTIEGMGSVSDMMKMKLESVASQLQSENDPRRINEYLETMEKIIDILDRLD